MPNSANGSIILSLIPDTNPPTRPLPSLSFSPNTAFLKVSLAVSKPIPEPSTILPIRPKPAGPAIKVPSVATPIIGMDFLTYFTTSLDIRPLFCLPVTLPSLSLICVPNKRSWISSLFLAKLIAEPKIAPPTGPNGVTNPATAPIPAPLNMSGAYFLSVAWAPLEIIPPLRIPSSPASPNKNDLNNSESLRIL